MGPDDAILFAYADDPPPPRRPGERLRWYRDSTGRERWERLAEDAVVESESGEAGPPRGEGDWWTTT